MAISGLASGASAAGTPTPVPRPSPAPASPSPVPSVAATRVATPASATPPAVATPAVATPAIRASGPAPVPNRLAAPPSVVPSPSADALLAQTSDAGRGASRERLDKLVPEAVAPTSTPSPWPTPDDTPTPDPANDWRAFVPTDTADHLQTMDRAARESNCGVPWQLLAAIARVESDFGRNMATSSAGAVGYGQFLPPSWAAFGNEGNIYDYRDALPAIARYLCSAGLARDPRQALFAYNHADWYVDMVLSLAVRYDRMAPGAPIPEVLSTDPGPAADGGPSMRYAFGRDLRLQSRARRSEGDAAWLGVPWRGRPPAASVSAAVMQTTALQMLVAAFGLKNEPAPALDAASPISPGDSGSNLLALADRAWESGLLPIDARDELNRQRGWSIAMLREHVARGEPVLAIVGSHALPGHPPTETAVDQPLLIVGLTPTGLVCSDPSFSSSLGYGLELSDAELEAAWQAARTPHQAVAFTGRPAPLAREAHLAQAEPGAAFARVTPTPTVLPTATVLAIPTPAAAPTEIDVVAAPNADEPASVQHTDPPRATAWPVATVAVGLVLATGALGRRRRR